MKIPKFYIDQVSCFLVGGFLSFLNFMKTRRHKTKATFREVWPPHWRSIIRKIKGKNVFKTAFSCDIFSQKNSTINIWGIKGLTCFTLRFTLTRKRQPRKMLKHTQTICRQKPTNCLSMLEYFVWLSFKRLTLSWLNIFDEKFPYSHNWNSAKDYTRNFELWISSQK